MRRKVISDSLLQEYTRVAYYYYKENNTQGEIAQRMHMSRQRVNRILGDCLDQGIVQISINSSSDVALLELETALKQKYGLRDARVVDNLHPEDIYRDLGRAAGKYLESILFKHCVIGVTRGRTLAQMAEQMPPMATEGVVIAQLMGSRNQEQPSTTPSEIIHAIAAKLNASPCLLFAPLIVGSAELKQSLLQDSSFREAYGVIRRCDITVAGIGNEPRVRELYAQSGVSIDQNLTLAPGQHVAGEVASHIFDGEGNPIHDALRDYMVAIELEDYLRIPVRIGVAGLPEKAVAIRSALMGKYINTLIVDTATAKILCDM